MLENFTTIELLTMYLHNICFQHTR